MSRPKVHRARISIVLALAACTALLCACSAGRHEANSGAAGGAARVQAGAAFLYPERIPLEDGSLAQAERGWVFVPVNRSRPDSGILAVEVYRFKAEVGAPAGVPPIFRLYGGPGFPGLQSRLSEPGFYEKTIAPWLRTADLVVVGQRGIGSTKPDTICEEPKRSRLDADVGEDEETAALRAAAAKCKTFWEQQGLDLRAFNVIEAAADIDDVRKALGYERIILHGVSFGSHWSMAVMRFHPAIVARALLGGMEGPDHTYDLPGEVLNSLQRMAAEAEKAPQLRSLVPQGGLIEAFRTVIARAEKQPVSVNVPDPKTGKPQTVRLDARRLRSLAYGYSGHSSSRSGARTWPADVLMLHRGDFRKAAETLIRNRDRRDMPTASFYMLDCGSGISPSRRAKLKADPAAYLLGRIGWSYEVACPVWETDLGESFRENFDTQIPTAIVHGNWDTSTPLENALELAPYFKQSRFVLVNGGTHGAMAEALDFSESFRRSVMEFVRKGDLAGLPDTVDLPPVDWVVPPFASVSDR